MICTLVLCGAVSAGAQNIVKTKAYAWHGDTISQGPFMATATADDEIVSTYAAQPGYRMGINKQWKRKNDLSSYPRLKSNNKLHEAIYKHVREQVAFYEVDREIWPDIRAVEKMIRSGELLDIVKEYIPDFE